MNPYNVLKSELLKLKYPPLIWLSVLVILAPLGVVFIAYLIEINNVITIGRNPWTRLNGSIHATYSIFIAIPFVVLFISAAVNVEYQSNGYKQLYTLPAKRSNLVMYKLLLVILCFIVIMHILIFGSLVIGYLLDSIYPEIEFSYYEFPILSILKAYAYLFIALLGVIGLQFYLSLRFRGFLIPASLGIFAYILGIILSSLTSKLAIYFPYCHPIVSRNNEVFNTVSLNIDQNAILNQVEITSILLFIVFALMSIYTEKVRKI